jgi:type I restriction-modification system DNA methylase subunit
MTAPAIIQDLVERFSRNFEVYKASSYNETQVRREFIDPFFEALGWDVNNRDGNAEAYKDVVHEDAVKVGGVTKAPDYSFRIGGTRKFFVEAKKPSISVKDDPAPAFQVRRYAWSAKLPLSIVTDFEEFAVYDCRIKPDQNDRADKARVLYLTFRQFVEKWDEIAAIFSKEAILKGSFDKYAESHKTKRGTSEVDNAFLEEIESWRDTLAKNIAIRNPALTVRELNEAVQRTIDRIIFLRIAEDRGIEEYGALRAICNGPNTFSRLRELFYKADDRYNSGLFHFKHEKGEAESPDSLTISLTIDDKPLKDILKRLYYPDSPYEFAVLPADILGQVYEQFLGKVIRLTSGHRAIVEDKPEVKKAGGVFYTPTYIVEYVVKKTVGILLQGKNPKQIEAIRILDPACGSGSFLLGAYQFLLDWHIAWYVANDPEKWAKTKQPLLYQGKGGVWNLTTAARKSILLNNIYGVDIDSQAVEVTKLSLLLKVLEGETSESLNQQMRLFHERALPDLTSNIKCGNSLIGYDFADKQTILFDDGGEEASRINVFEWALVFPEIHSAGGFDAIIGNPPYIRIQTMKEFAPKEILYYKDNYRAAAKGNYDIYVLFVEKALQLLNTNGKLGFILPHKFFNAQYGEPLRGLISEGKHISQIVHFGHQQVFSTATTYTCLLFLDSVSQPSFRFTKVHNLDGWREVCLNKTTQITESTEGLSIKEPEIRYLAKVGISTTSTTIFDEGEICADGISSAAWNFSVSPGADLFSRLNDMPVKLGDVMDIFVGLQTSADKVFIMNLVKENATTLLLKSVALGQEWELEKGLLEPLVSGTDVNRYAPLPARQYIIFPYLVKSGIVELVSFKDIQRDYPKIASYLLANRKTLEEREKGKFKDQSWYRFGRNQNLGIQKYVKLCVPRLIDRLYAAFDIDGNHYLDNVDVGGLVLKPEYQEQGLLYLLGLLNSSILRWFFPFVSAPFRGGWLSANRQFLSLLPIRPIDFTNPVDKASHDRMGELVEQMLALQKQLQNAKATQDQTFIKRQIDTNDRQIDKLVYELYGVTDEEIAVVGGAYAHE